MTIALRSALLTRAGFAHGFSLRTGGVSEAPFSSLNLGGNVGDRPEAVAENKRLFAVELGHDPAGLFEVSQVHGPGVRVVEATDTVADVRLHEADALVTGVSGVAVGVRVADCAPVLIAHPPSGLVAAVHAGWRGVAGRVVDRAIDVMCARGVGAPSELYVAIGPHIRACCFEVGEEVATELAAQAYGADVVRREAGKPRVDLVRILRAQLAARGIADDHVDDVGGCTRCEPDRFFSFRREGEKSGRHLGVIVAL